MYSSVIFNAFLLFYNHYHYMHLQNSLHFSKPKLCPLNNDSCPYSPQPLTVIICVLSLWFWPLEVPYLSETMQHVLLGLAYFTWCNILKVHPCCIDQNSFRFQVCTVLPIHSFGARHIGCLGILGVVSKAAINMGVTIPSSNFQSLCYTPRSGAANCMVMLFLIF
jgi:hypothetical protein